MNTAENVDENFVYSIWEKVFQLLFKMLPISIDRNIEFIAKVDEHQKWSNFDPMLMIPLHEWRELALHFSIGFFNSSKTCQKNGDRFQFIEPNTTGELPFKIKPFFRWRIGGKLNRWSRHWIGKLFEGCGRVWFWIAQKNLKICGDFVGWNSWQREMRIDRKEQNDLDF